MYWLNLNMMHNISGGKSEVDCSMDFISLHNKRESISMIWYSKYEFEDSLYQAHYFNRLLSRSQNPKSINIFFLHFTILQEITRVCK